MTRVHPFMLNVQRNGTSMPSKLFFETEGEMINKVKDILKRPFIGKMEGFVHSPDTRGSRTGEWTPVQAVADMQVSDSNEERSHAFQQAASFLKFMSKVKEPLDAAQISEFKDILEELFQVYDAEEKRLPTAPEPEPVKAFTSVNMV